MAAKQTAAAEAEARAAEAKAAEAKARAAAKEAAGDDGAAAGDGADDSNDDSSKENSSKEDSSSLADSLAGPAPAQTSASSLITRASSDLTSPATVAAGFDHAGAARLLEEEVKDAVYSTVGAAGASFFFAVFLSGFLDNFAEDVLAFSLTAAVGYVSVLSLPLKRAETKAKARAVAESFLDEVEAAMRAEFERRLARRRRRFERRRRRGARERRRRRSRRANRDGIASRRTWTSSRGTCRASEASIACRLLFIVDHREEPILLVRVGIDPTQPPPRAALFTSRYCNLLSRDTPTRARTLVHCPSPVHANIAARRSEPHIAVGTLVNDCRRGQVRQRCDCPISADIVS